VPSNVVGAQLQKLREARGWSQEVLAGELQRGGWEISRGTLAKIEARIRCVNDEELLYFSRAFGVSVNQLYPGNVRRASRHA
jgi:transcriptional regulator with XRE-family HTH domain